MDVELRSLKNPDETIKVLYNHWITVLKPQGGWEVVEAHTKDLKVMPSEEKKEPKGGHKTYGRRKSS